MTEVTTVAKYGPNMPGWMFTYVDKGTISKHEHSA